VLVLDSAAVGVLQTIRTPFLSDYRRSIQAQIYNCDAPQKLCHLQAGLVHRSIFVLVHGAASDALRDKISFGRRRPQRTDFRQWSRSGGLDDYLLINTFSIVDILFIRELIVALLL
jgi:hypothetical protein